MVDPRVYEAVQERSVNTSHSRGSEIYNQAKGIAPDIIREAYRIRIYSLASNFSPPSRIGSKYKKVISFETTTLGE